jgi:hypothetical protein
MPSQAAFFVQAVRSWRRKPLSYTLGRFPSVRRAFGLYTGFAQRLSKRFEGAQVAKDGRVLFDGLDADAAIASLRSRSYYAPLHLPADIVAAIRGFAFEATCRRQQRPPLFRAGDVQGGRLPNGEFAVLADVLDSDRHDAVRDVAHEPSVFAVVSRYLGYVPRVRTRLIWSFVCDAPHERRLREGQTVDYHFDVESYNFIYANYYLSNVDADSGAHTMIVGSHEDKPVAWLFGSANKPDAIIREHYGADREIVLSGPAGYGFIQDASCYHRALPPRARDRLMLQVRYC